MKIGRSLWAYPQQSTCKYMWVFHKWCVVVIIAHCPSHALKKRPPTHNILVWSVVQSIEKRRARDEAQVHKIISIAQRERNCFREEQRPVDGISTKQELNEANAHWALPPQCAMYGTQHSSRVSTTFSGYSPTICLFQRNSLNNIFILLACTNDWGGDVCVRKTVCYILFSFGLLHSILRLYVHTWALLWTLLLGNGFYSFSLWN